MNNEREHTMLPLSTQEAIIESSKAHIRRREGQVHEIQCMIVDLNVRLLNIQTEIEEAKDMLKCEEFLLEAVKLMNGVGCG